MSAFDKNTAELIAEYDAEGSIESLYGQGGKYFLEVDGVSSDTALAIGARDFSVTEITRHSAIMWLRRCCLPVPDSMLVRTTPRPISAETAIRELCAELNSDELTAAIQTLLNELAVRTAFPKSRRVPPKPRNGRLLNFAARMRTSPEPPRLSGGIIRQAPNHDYQL